MSANSFGRRITMTSFGESHGEGYGVVLDGLPAGFEVDIEKVQQELNRRKPGQSEVVTPRQEKDILQVLSGLYEGKTTGAPLAFFVKNEGQNSQDYANIQDWWRPGHADAVYEIKYGVRDPRGGGRASARETLARVLAGAIAKQMLGRLGLHIFAYVHAIGPYEAESVEPDFVEKNPFRVPDPALPEKLHTFMEDLREAQDSIGGVLHLQAEGLPVGLGQPLFQKLSADIASAMMSLPAIKALEFGEGRSAATMKGSEHNDAWTLTAQGPRPASNHAGGLSGGISTGAPLTMKLTFKAPSSIAQEQSSLNKAGFSETKSVQGRHDPCVLPRVVPVAEAMLAWVLLDHYLLNMGTKFQDLEAFYFNPHAPLHSFVEARKSMDALDESLVSLMAKRLIWAKKLIAKRMAEGGLVQDSSREEILKKHHEALAKKHGVEGSFVQDFFQKIIALGKKDF